MKLGKKIDRGVRKLGHKIDKKAHQLGHKSHDVLQKAQKINRKAVNTGSKVLHNVRKGADIADAVLGAAVDAGAGSVPIVGDGIALASKGLHGARKGLDKGDKALHKYKNASNKALKHANKHANDLEKFNVRKKIAQATADEDGFA